MSRPAFALAPGPVERALRSGVALYVALLVAAPLLALAYVGLSQGASEFFGALSAPVAQSALWLTTWTALLVAAINAVFGTATAWVLVRYLFPGRSTISALIDLPLSVPTLVAGLMIGVLYGPSALVGKQLSALGIQVVFAPPAIVLALLFVTLPFVIRAVEPVLLEVDPAEEEAAVILGAGPLRAFRTVYLPAILPAALSSSIRAIGRAMGEFGSVVVVAGNIPFETLTAPVYIFGEIESGLPRSGAAVAIAMLIVALLLHGLAAAIETRTRAARA